MMLGAFLLLNLIIALFSNTIDSINNSARSIWKFSRVEMVYEYHEKNLTPPPFAIIPRLLFVLYWLIQQSPVASLYRRRFDREFPVLRRQIVSKMVCLDVGRLLVGRHNLGDEVAQRFLRLLRKYEKTHAAPKQIYACDPPRSDGE